MLDVVNANYTPKASGETEYIRIEIDAEETYTSTSFFAVRAIDKAGNVGDVSNIVSILVANGYRIKAEGTVDFQYSPAEDHDEDYDEDDVEDDVEDHVKEPVKEPVKDTVKLGKEDVKADLTMLVIGLSCAATAFVSVVIAVVVRVKKSKSDSITLTDGKLKLACLLVFFIPERKMPC